MTTVTGNPERDQMIFVAMQAAANADQILNLDNVAAHLPSDFDLLPGELVAARHVAKLDSVAEPEAGPEAEPEARLTQAQALTAVASAANRLGNARLAVRVARSALDVQRGKLAEAISAWQNGGPKWTPEMERKHMQEFYAATKRSGPRMSTRKFAPQAVIEGRGVVTGYKGSRRNGLPSEYQHRNVATPGIFQGAQAKKV